MATCTVTGTIKDLLNVAIQGAYVRARTIYPFVDSATAYVPQEVSVSTNVSGIFTMTLQQSLSVIFVVEFPASATDSRRSIAYSADIPATTSANFTSIILVE